MCAVANELWLLNSFHERIFSDLPWRLTVMVLALMPCMKVINIKYYLLCWMINEMQWFGSTYSVRLILRETCHWTNIEKKWRRQHIVKIVAWLSFVLNIKCSHFRFHSSMVNEMFMNGIAPKTTLNYHQSDDIQKIGSEHVARMYCHFHHHHPPLFAGRRQRASLQLRTNDTVSSDKESY